MKLTIKKLKQLIKEEVGTLSESWSESSQMHGDQMKAPAGDVYMVMLEVDYCLDVQAVFRDLKNAEIKLAELQGQLGGYEPIGYKIVPMNFSD